MDFLQGEELSEQREKLAILLKVTDSHLQTLKEEELADLPDDTQSDQSLKKIGERNVYLLRKYIDDVLTKSDMVPQQERIRLLRHKTKALSAGKTLTEAKECALEAYNLAKSNGFRHWIWSTSLDLTMVERCMGRLSGADKYLNIAFEHISSVIEEQETTVMKGDLLLARGQLNEGIETIFNPLLEKVEDKRIKGLLLQKLGNGCRSAANWGQAKQYLRQSIEIAQELQNAVDEFDRHGDLGNVYRSEGRIRDALQHQWLHLKFALNRGDLTGLTAACFNVGFSNYTIKPQPNLDNAMVFTLLNNILATQCHHEPLRGISLNNLGKIFMAMELYEAAIPILHECVQVAKETENFGGEGMAYGNLGTAHRALKNYEYAIKYHEMYKENARNRGDDGGMSIMQTELTLDHLLKGDLDNALKEVTASISTNEAIRAQLGTEDASKLANFEKNQATAFNLLILILKKQKKYKEALAISELGRARALTDRICHIKSGSSQNCSKWLWMENVLVDQLLDEKLTNEIVQDYIAAATKLNSNFLVYSLVTEFDKNGKQQKWLYMWAVLPQLPANSTKETVNFRSIKIGDSTDRTGMNLDETFFTNLTRSFGETNKIMLDCLDENIGTGTRDLPKDKEAVPTISSTYSLTPGAVSIIEMLEQLKFGKVNENVTAKFDEDDEVILKLRNMRLEFNESPGERVQVQDDWAKDGHEQLRALYEVCFAPIGHILDEKSDTDSVKRLIIIPQEFLFNIPFCALQRADGRYLIQDYIISYTPSLRALLLLQEIQSDCYKMHQGKLKVLAVGNPDMPFKQVTQIEHAEEEARIVHDIFGEENGILLTKDKATKSAVLLFMKEVDILHIATHAFPKDLFQRDQEGDYIMRGCILLSKSNDKCSGLLHAYEIEKEKNNLQLVVLSCCETGLGKVTGDGIVGLYRAFLAAGTSAVLVTMWKIRDDITPTIMKTFYEEYRTSRDAPAALRMSMLNVCINLKLPPDQWAAFSLVGACMSI